MAETTMTGKASTGSLNVWATIWATRRIRSPLPTEVPPNFKTCTEDFIGSPNNRIREPGQPHELPSQSRYFVVVRLSAKGNRTRYLVQNHLTCSEFPW